MRVFLFGLWVAPLGIAWAGTSSGAPLAFVLALFHMAAVAGVVVAGSQQ